VFEDRALSRIFDLKEEVTGRWKNLYNEGAYNLFFSPNIVRVYNQEE
jgi:hypothetical protein